MDFIRQFNIMMQRTANEIAACLRRICKRSDQPKIERIANNDGRLILHKKLNAGDNDMIESKLKANNCNRGQLFPPYWVSSARRSKFYEVISWLTDIHILTIRW